MPRLQLLGVARLPAPGSGAALQLQYRKGWALLGYLAVERGRRHLREQLAGLLWPALGATAARTNLRQVLGNLQQQFRELGFPDLIHADKTTIGVIPQDPSALLFDIDLLDPLLIDEDEAVQQLAGEGGWQHRGMFLEGVGVPDSTDFEDWLGFTREHFLRREIRLMCGLRDHFHALGSRAEALDLAWRLTRIDDWNEGHYRALMLLLSEDGAMHDVQRVYAALESSLRRHLDCAPSAETAALYASLQSRG